MHVGPESVSVEVEGGGVAVCDLVTSAPGAGWAEQQPDELWRAVLAATRSALDHSPAPDRLEVSAGPTFVVWDQESLGAARPALAPGDARCAGGVVSALGWLADHEPHTWASVATGRYAVGTVDSYVVARMTRGTWFVTGRDQAARTGLLDTPADRWSRTTCERLGVPLEALAEILDPGDGAGTTDPACFLGLSLPIRLA